MMNNSSQNDGLRPPSSQDGSPHSTKVSTTAPDHMRPGGNPTSQLSAAQSSPMSGARLNSVDALRGLVMILMALDHTREYFHNDAMLFAPEDLRHTTALLFFTRWVTHICAPVFLFTAGLGAFLRWKRGTSTGELSRFLWKRGAWLMLLELTVLRLAYNFSLFSGPVVLTVLWVIGLSMVVLGFLVWLPTRVLAVLSVLVTLLHNLADRVDPQLFGSTVWVWNLLHQPGLFRVGDVMVISAYTLIPWVAVMAMGFCFGHILVMEDASRRRLLLRIGLGLTGAFLIIRWLNAYGDPFPWSAQTPGTAILSFLRTAKYPPSLSFLLMTIGPAILLLRWMDEMRLSKSNALIVFGRVPLFYFLCHLFAIHGLAVLFALVRYGQASFLFEPLPSSGGSMTVYPAGYGYDLWVVYVVWLVVVALMYPLCRWFAGVRERRRDWWLSYL